MTLPAIDDLNAVGGIITDYRTPPDPTVERNASNDNQIAADATMATRTITRGFVAWQAGTTPTVMAHEALWGNGSPVAPVVVHVSTGVYTITWPANVTDGLGVVQALNLRRGWGAVALGTVGIVQVYRTGPNVVQVSTFNPAGTANDLAGAYVDVYVV
jgi:hypothetical protein